MCVCVCEGVCVENAWKEWFHNGWVVVDVTDLSSQNEFADIQRTISSSLFCIYVNAAYNDDLVSFGLNRFKSVTNIMGKI